MIWTIILEGIPLAASGACVAYTWKRCRDMEESVYDLVDEHVKSEGVRYVIGKCARSTTKDYLQSQVEQTGEPYIR